MVKRKATLKRTISTKSKVTRTTKRRSTAGKSMIGKPSNPFYIDNVRPLI